MLDWLRWITSHFRPESPLIARYKHLRRVALQLNTRLAESLPQSVIEEGGKKLGMIRRKVLTLDSQDMVAVLMDYCIYDVRRKGLNGVERFLAESPPPADSDEMVLLQAMRQARYSLFAVESRERGVGVHVRDLLRDEPLFLVDVGFSRTARSGLVLAARIMALEGFTQTTGAALPLGFLEVNDRAALRQALLAQFKVTDFLHLSPARASELAAEIIRLCLKRGAAEHIAYQ